MQICKTSLISVRFTGGIGNRLFQYHTATYLAKVFNKNFIFDTSKMRRNLHEDCKIEMLYDHPIQRNVQYHTLITQKSFNISDWKQQIVNSKQNGNILLRGYFQTFWEGHITIPKLPTLYISFEPTKSIMIHVRRGDFLKHRHHFINLEKYYQNCISEYNKIFDDSLFVIFSDDITWVKTNMTVDSSKTIIIDENTIHSLTHMSKCHRGAILSNSTFGLWGAYLAKHTGENSDYFAFVPSRFMATKKLHHTRVGDLIFPNWTKRVLV